ncbi:MAG TPA: hypothetical protein PLL92_03250 [Alicycliphilus sp.]|nr:hypothetical protein [Alicycliphilus sp.]
MKTLKTMKAKLLADTDTRAAYEARAEEFIVARLDGWLGAARDGDFRGWLAQQSAYDVWQAAQRFKKNPMHVQPAPVMA